MDKLWAPNSSFAGRMWSFGPTATIPGLQSRGTEGVSECRGHKRMSIMIPYTCNLQICSKRVRIGAIQPSEILEEKPCMPCMLFFVNTCFQQKQYCFYANSALPLSGTNMCNEHLTYSYNPSPSCFFTSDQLFPLFITDLVQWLQCCPQSLDCWFL